MKGYPTLKYVKKGGEVLDYAGDRSLKDLITFVETKLGITSEDPKEAEKEPAATKESEKKEEL